MIVKRLEVHNFRNYKRGAAEFSGGLNVLCGSNASGKTNLVESIYYAGLGKSPRTSRDKELVRWGENNAYIRIELEKKYRSHTIEIYIDNTGSKRIAIDGIAIRRISELIGVLNVVYFSPDELDIIKEGPQERRRFLDISLSQQKKIYFNNLVRYNKVLSQRNKLLKTYNNEAVIRETLPIWDMQLADVGSKVIKDRYEFCTKLREITEKKHSFLTDGCEKLSVEYESRIRDGKLTDIQEEYINLLTSSREKDIDMQYTTQGLHRDDISLEIDGVDIRKYGSQGQKRTTALSLKLAEVSLFEGEVGESPVLILDDVLSELDMSRQAKLLTAVREVQTFITCTNFTDEYDRRFEIQRGEIKRN